MDIDDKTLLNLISKLPQVGVMKESDITDWIKRTRKSDPDRIEWHIKRARGFGGSDIGTLITGLATDGFSPFSSANDIVRQKLFASAPTGGTGPTTRGTILEPFVADLFESNIRLEGSDIRRLTEFEEILSNDQHHPDYQWLLASVDGVYEINGENVLVDFKCPGPDILSKYLKHGGYDDYIAQLHHYRLSAVGKDVKIDRMMLAFFDYHNGTVVNVDIPHDENLDSTILEAGEYYWKNHVLKGVIPEYTARPVVQAEEEMPETIKTAFDDWSFAKIIEKPNSSKMDLARDTLEAWIKSIGELGTSRFNHDVVQVSAKTEYDIDAMLHRLKDFDIAEEKLERCRFPSKYDTKKISASYDEFIFSVKNLLTKIKNKVNLDEEEIKDLSEKINSAPIKSLGEYDPDELSKLLVSCKENPDNYYKEKLSVILPRSKARLDVGERKDLVEGHFSDFQEELALTLKEESGIQDIKP